MRAPPDILWIVTTQWRAQALRSAGDVNASTPAVDTLAANGINFAQGVTPHPFGPFARAAMLTGLPSPENGVRDYFDPLPTTARTIAHDMGDLGYATGFFGKWHLARRDPAASLVGEAHARTIVPVPARGGFGYWEGFESGFLINDPWLHGTTIEQPKRFPGYQSDVVCDRAAAWLAARNGKPWFAMVSLEPPHPPYDSPAGGVPALEPSSLQLPLNVPRGGDVERRARRDLAGYYAHIAATDRSIGRLVQTLDRRAEAQGRSRPLVVVTSVHGDMHGAHGLFRKGWPHEESVRVPLIVRMPDGSKPGSADAAVSLLDLPAATRAWARGEAPDFSRTSSRISMPSIVALKEQCDRVWTGLRTRARKLVLDGDGTPWLFFDLEQDPGEQANLVHDPSRRAEMHALQHSITADPGVR